MRRLTLFVTALLLLFSVISCSEKAERLSRVIVIGEANLQAQPDTAVLVISVITQHQRALEAQQENARKSDTVIDAVRQTAGTNPEIKTSDYSLQPQQDYREHRLPKIIGYEARNSVTVMMSDLNKVGAVIDAASQAGANSIEKVSYILREDNPKRGETLAQATRQAMSKAQSIAQALKGRIVRVVEEHEAGVVHRPFYDDAEEHLEAGVLHIKSQVQLVVEIEAQQ